MQNRSGSTPIKVLYAAYRHDPQNPDLASGADYRFAKALRDQGFDVRYSGPVVGEAWPIERLFRRFYRRLSNRDYTKFPLSLALRSSRQLQQAARTEKPDLIFTLFPPPLVFYRGTIPTIYRLDTTFIGWQEQYPQFGRLALKFSVWQERRALAKATRLITHSQWTRDLLINAYAQPETKIHVWPNPASLPRDTVPSPAVPEPFPDGKKEGPETSPPLRLLLVGRDAHRKGVDLGIEVFRQLKNAGMAVELTVCGLSQQEAALEVSEDGLRFVGPFRKTLPAELEAYVDLYRKADLLLHPARFDPSPIVISEAAAFSVPTLTNACGGLTTSVLDGRTGIVLPRGSAPSAYVAAIVEQLADRKRLLSLGAAARARYKRELNWDVLGHRLGDLVREMVAERERLGPNL